MKKVLLLFAFLILALATHAQTNVNGNYNFTGVIIFQTGPVSFSYLTPGHCMQAGTGGSITTVSGPCGTSSGTITATGSPASGQGSFWSGAGSITGSPNWLYSATGGHTITQGANGAVIIQAYRNTDTSPTGYLFNFQNAAQNATLYYVDINGSSLGASFSTLSANPAQSGIFRCASSDLCVSFRNNANSSDVGLGKNSSDQPTFGGNVVPTISGFPTTGHVATFAGNGQIQDGGVSGAAVAAFYNNFVSGSVGTGATVLGTQTITFPSSGGPYRINSGYELYLTFSAALRNVDFWVSDGSSSMSGCSTANSNGISGGKGFCVPGAPWSPTTYAAGSTYTFTLYGQGSSTAATVYGSQLTGAGPASDWQLAVMASN